jgi:methylated-DNA-[protein]-cysteine S-methyltransferase
MTGRPPPSHHLTNCRHDRGGDSRYNRSMTTSSPRAYATVESPVGSLLLAGDDQGLRLIHFQTGKRRTMPDRSWRLDERHFADVIGQLEAYFAGELRSFHLQIAPEGTPFQLAVWRALLAIPYGETISYGELAGRIGNPRASRAVGAANARNPLPIVVPCHRVIGGDGSLTGYGGGVRIKEALLALERGHRR